jgi:hypothetical protein
VAINKTREKFFEIGNKPVRLLDPDAEGCIRPQVLTTDSMVAELNEHVRWMKKSREGCPLVVTADDDVAKQILNQTSLHFPQLDSIVSSPYFTKDGVLIAERGYNADARTFYNPPADFALPELPNPITFDHVIAAKKLIMDNVLVDFPWSDGREGEEGDGQSSKAHALVLLLQQHMRPMIPGNLPIALVVKPEAGSGATLLIRMLMFIALGREVGAQTEKSSSDELRKAITAHVLSKETVFWLDNINAHVHGAALANFVTCGIWDDRKLGVSENVRALVTSTAIVSGNNVGMSWEIGRRSVPIKLDAGRDPLERMFFTHDLETWVPENRAALVGACVTLIKYWIDQGCPEWDGKPLSSFEGYSKTMGGLLECIGVEGFLENLDLTKEASSSETEDWAAFFGAWFDTHGDKPRSIGNPFDGGGSGVARGEFDGDKSLLRLIEAHGLSIPMKGASNEDKVTSLGQLLRYRKGRVYKHEGRSMRLTSDGRGAKNKQLWSVSPVKIDPFMQAAEGIWTQEADWSQESAYTEL